MANLSTQASELEYFIEKFTPECLNSGVNFVLAGKKNRPLKSFFKKEASFLEENNYARTYILKNNKNNDVVGFITLVVGDVSVKKISVKDPDGTGAFRYPTYPSMKIARLAIHDNYRAQKLGSSLVEFALGIAKEQICAIVGCRLVTVDAKKDSIPFYKKCGFRLVDTSENIGAAFPFMFLDLKER